MSSHEAQAQMLGYLYQVRCALMLLIESDTPSLKLFIEKSTMYLLKTLVIQLPWFNSSII